MLWNLIGSIVEILIVIFIWCFALDLPLLTGGIVILVACALWIATSIVTVRQGECESLQLMHLIVALITALALIFTPLFALNGILMHYTLEGYSEVCTAEILEIVPKARNQNAYLKVEVDSGDRYTVPIYNDFVGMVGDTIEVVYNPNADTDQAYASMYSQDMTLADGVIITPNPKIISQ